MGTINGSTSDSSWTFKIDWSESSLSDTNNTSKVTAKIYIGRASTRSYLGGNYSATITINGTKEDFSGNISYPTYINGGAWLGLKEKSVTVTHGSDGSKSITISASMSSGDFTPGYCSASGTATLSTLDRNAPTVTASISSSSITTTGFNLAVTSSEAATSSSGFAYQLDGGDWNYWSPGNTTTTSHTFNITGLSINTSYNVVAAVKRNANGVWGYSASQSVKTLGMATLRLVNDVTLGNATNAYWTPLDSNHTFKLVLSRTEGGTTATKTISSIAASTAGTERTYSIAAANLGISTWAPVITTSNKGDITATLYTYTNSTQTDANLIGSTSTTFKATVPNTSGTTPVLNAANITFSDGNTVFYSTFGISGRNNSYISGLSSLKAVVAATSTYPIYYYGASLKSISMQVRKNSSSGTILSTKTSTTSTIISDILSLGLATGTTTGTIYYSISIIDSRGFSSNNITGTLTVYNYWAPGGSVSYTIDNTTHSITSDITWNIAPLNNLNLYNIILTRSKGTDSYTITNKTVSNWNSGTEYKRGMFCLYPTTGTQYVYEYIYSTASTNKNPSSSSNSAYWRQLGKKDADNGQITTGAYSGSYTWAQSSITDANMTTYQYVLTVEDLINENSYTASTGVVCISRHRGGRGITFFADASDSEIGTGGLWANSIRFDLTTDEYITLAGSLASQYSSTTTYSDGDFVKYTVSSVEHVYEYIYTSAASGKVPTNTTYWVQLS